MEGAELADLRRSLRTLLAGEAAPGGCTVASAGTLEEIRRETQSGGHIELVVPEVSDLDKGLISVASPIGKAIMGSEEGDELRVTTPSGTREFEVLDLKTIHDKED